MSDFLMTTYLSCLVQGCFYKRLVFQWVRIAPLIADLFLHAYKADFLQGFFKNKDRKLAQIFNSSFHFIDGVLSLNNSRFGDYLHSIKDTTDTQKSASYLDLHLEIDNGGRFKNKTTKNAMT